MGGGTGYIEQQTGYLQRSQLRQVEILQRCVFALPLWDCRVFTDRGEVEIKCLGVNNLNTNRHTTSHYPSVFTWPEVVLNLISLKPGLLAPVSVARLDFIGLQSLIILLQTHNDA